MTVDVKAFLPNYEVTSIYWLKSLIRGEKKFVKADKIRYLSVPQYKGLGIAQFLEQAQKYPEVLNYLPDQDEWIKLPRQWLISVIYTLVGKTFADWASQLMDVRNEKVIEK